MSDLTKNARKDYEEIIKGKEGHWFDSGEYEILKQEWFNKYGIQLVEALENCEKDTISP